MKARFAIATAIVTTAAALPAAAVGSTIEVTAGAGPSNNEYIDYVASKGEKNRVRVLIKKNTLVFVDKGTKRIRPKQDFGFGRCKATSPRRVVCPNFPLIASLRDGNDRFSVAPGDKGSPPTATSPLKYAETYEDTEGAIVEALIVDMGTGDDFVSGSRYNDVLIPGRGRDHVEGRGGPDQIYTSSDGSPDSLDGGGDADSVSFNAQDRLTVDLTAGTAIVGGETDTVRGLERVHGGQAADVLRGSERTDALYGEGGADTVDGRGGNDLIVGDSPLTMVGAANTLVGGEGDDIVDTRVERATPTSTADCGPGTDAFAGGVDTRLGPSCELTIPRLPFGSLTTPTEENLFDGSPTRAVPVAKTPDTATFDVACPSTDDLNHGGCAVTIALERPPTPGSDAPPEQLGSGNADIEPGAHGNVTVTLNAAGQAAVASGDPVAVRAAIDLKPLPGSPPGTAPAKLRWGWQADL